MSRIGREPITVPAGVEITVEENNRITVKGPKGSITQSVPASMQIERDDAGVLHVKRPDDTKENRSLHGLTRSLIHNMVVGVTQGFEKKLEINGVGYRAAKEGTNLVMNLRTSRSTFPMPTTSSSRASTSRRSASLPQKSVVRDLPSRTRARASSMTTRRSAAKKARPAQSKGGVS